MMFCSNCGKKLDEDISVCPYCNSVVFGVQKKEQDRAFETSVKMKKKKKRLMIGIAVAIFSLIVIICLADTEDLSQATFSDATPSTISDVQNNDYPLSETVSDAENTELSPTENEELNITVSMENGATQTQTSKTSSVVEFYQSYQKVSSIKYDLSGDSIAVLNEKDYLFPCNPEYRNELSSLAEYIPHGYLAKSISKYTQTIICVENVSVLDIVEYDDYTYIHVTDDDLNSYVGVSIGTLPKIFDDDDVVLYGLPLDMVSFNNRGGGSTKAVFMAVCACELKGDVHGVYDYENDVVWEYGNNVGDYLADDPKSYFISLHERSLGYNDLPYMYNVDVGAGTSLNLRTSWSTDADIVTELPHGTLLCYYGEYQGWAFVTVENYYSGWVKAEYIHPTDDFYYE